MTTRRRKSDFNERKTRKHKYRRVQPEILDQACPFKGHISQSEKGVSPPKVSSCASPVWQDNSCVTAENPNMDPGLGYLSLLSPEIRDLIYELIPVEDNPEIASPCQLKELCLASRSLSLDLHRLSRYRLEESMRDGTVIEKCCLPNSNEPALDQFDWQHKFFDCKAEWESRPQGEDWLPSR